MIALYLYMPRWGVQCPPPPPNKILATALLMSAFKGLESIEVGPVLGLRKNSACLGLSKLFRPFFARPGLWSESNGGVDKSSQFIYKIWGIIKKKKKNQY